MLDIKFIRENPDIVKNACAVKGFADHTDEILSLDTRVRELKKTATKKTTTKKTTAKKTTAKTTEKKTTRKKKEADE